MALLHADFFSHVLQTETQMDVILPESADGQIGMAGKNGGERIPTLYLLHGMSDDQTIWQRRTSVERYVSDLGIAVVMPTTRLGWYTDMYAGPRYFTFISRELPKICRQMFPKLSPRREDTFAAGLSMGGYGALKCGLRAPDVFSKVASLSGAVDACEIAKRSTDDPYWTDLFGPAENVPNSFDDLLCAAGEIDDPALRPDVFMWCGTEDFLYPLNLRMRGRLQALHYNLRYEESSGDHQWKYWDAQIQTVLDWLFPKEAD